MKNQRGYATIGVVVTVLILTLAISTIFLNPILNTSLNTKQAKDIIPQYVQNMNGIERVYSKLKQNVSLNEPIIFSDISKEYEITEVNSEYQQENLSFTGNSNSFSVNNKTDVNIGFQVSQVDSDFPYYYDAKIVQNGETVASISNKNTDISITIDEQYLYNETNGETNYGEYEIIIDTYNSTVDSTVSFNQLTYREIELSNDNINQLIGITRNTNDFDIHFIQ